MPVIRHTGGFLRLLHKFLSRFNVKRRRGLYLKKSYFTRPSEKKKKAFR